MFESESFARASIDGFFLSVEVPAGGDADKVAADVAPAAGAIARRDRRGVGAMTTRGSFRLLMPRLLPRWRRSACDENILDPMADRQPRADRYKESVFFDDGLSMRAPPEGTVPRERITQNPTLTTGREGETGQIAANGEPLAYAPTTIPLPVTRKLLELGRKRFDITCATCHGPVGDGDSIVATPDVAAAAAVAAQVQRPRRRATSSRSSARASASWPRTRPS